MKPRPSVWMPPSQPDETETVRTGRRDGAERIHDTKYLTDRIQRRSVLLEKLQPRVNELRFML
jgi:hypothetical protein